MNLAMVKHGVKVFFRNAVYFVKRNAPQIMVGTGLAAGGATVVLACKATLKTKDILDAKDEAMIDNAAGDLNVEKEIKRTARWELLKTWVPVGTAGAASVALILGGHHILGRRTAAALGAAYKAQTELFKRDKAIEEAFGEDIARKLKEGLPIGKEEAEKAVEAAEQKRIKKEEKKKLRADNDNEFETVEFLFCEETCGPRFYGGGMWTPDPQTNLSRVLGVLQTMMDRLRLDGHLTINDVFKDGFGRRMEGHGIRGDLGWVDDPVLGHDMVDFGLGELADLGSEEYRRFCMGDNPNILFRFRVRKTPIINYIDDINARRETALKRKTALGGYSPKRKR